MGMGGMFSRVGFPPGTVVHKATGEGGARYGAPRGGVGAGVGFDGSLHRRCTTVPLPPLGSEARAALDPPEDTALRWDAVNCPACLAVRYVRPPLDAVIADPDPFCACGHGEAVHLKALGGRCSRCTELGEPERCTQGREAGLAGILAGFEALDKAPPPGVYPRVFIMDGVTYRQESADSEAVEVVE